MVVNFECLEESFQDRFDLMNCLVNIRKGYENSKYVDVDDICNFLKKVRPLLYNTIEKLNREGNNIGIGAVLENTFAVILHIHERTKHKVDLLDEFNIIHEIFEGYSSDLPMKTQLKILREIYDQCKKYYDRPMDELKQAREKRQENRITPEDYAFLRDQ